MRIIHEHISEMADSVTIYNEKFLNPTQKTIHGFLSKAYTFQTFIKIHPFSLRNSSGRYADQTNK